MADIEIVRGHLAALTKQITRSEISLGPAHAHRALDRLADAYLAQQRVIEAAATAHKFAGDVMLFASDARAPVPVDWLVVSVAAARVKDELAAALESCAAVSVGSPETSGK